MLSGGIIFLIMEGDTGVVGKGESPIGMIGSFTCDVTFVMLSKAVREAMSLYSIYY